MRCTAFVAVGCLVAGLFVGPVGAAPRDRLRYPDTERGAAHAQYESESDDRDWWDVDDADYQEPLDDGEYNYRTDERDYEADDRADSRDDESYAPARRPASFSDEATREPADEPDGRAPIESIDAGFPSYGGPCDSCGGDDCCAKADWLGKCCRTPWRWCGIYGDFLFLQARNASVPFAVPQNGIGFAGAAPNGPAGSVVPVYRPGFRVGGAVLIGPASRLTGSYTWYESHTSANLSVPPGGVVNPLTMFPGTFNAGFTAETSTASHDLDFQLADANYEALFVNCDRRWIGLMGGAVYGQLQQDFSAYYPFSPPDGPTTVESHVDFHGAGIQVGIEGEQRIWRKLGFCVYGRGMSRFLCGQFRSSYLQTNEFNGVEATTSIKDARIVPLLDLEIGVSWISPKAGVRLYGGYMINSWFNSVSTPGWIGSVQNSSLLPGSNSITFDGLVARAQIAF
ncbi:MAG: Lpg1974 family pore-forming outer membrane protein [Pirellulales bacterium]